MISKDKLIDWLKQHRDYYHDGSTMSEDASHFGEVAIKEVIEHVEQLPDSLPWTTDKPTKPGWYWARTSGKPVDETEIVRLTWMRGIDDQADAQDALVVHFNPGGWPFAHDVMKGIPLDELEGEWYGPLEVPE